MKKSWIALPLAAVLAFCAGCRPSTSPEPEPLPTVTPTAPPAFLFPSETPTPEEETLRWSTEAVLSADMLPGNYNGLELPVRGATGYASIELPLWGDPEDAENAAQAVEEWKQLQEQAEEEMLPPEQDISAAVGGEEEPDDREEQEEQGELLDEDVLVEEADVPPMEDTPETPDGDGHELPESEETSPSKEPEQTGESAEDPGNEDETPTYTDGALAILPPGAAFTVLEESGDWWYVKCTETEEDPLLGWVKHKWCMVNLPDVVPSIIYNATNAYSSRFVSRGKPLEGVTGQSLYPGKATNARLGRKEFMMPVLYSMSLRLCAAQRAALEQGNCLVLYEGYRPYETQRKVCDALAKLMRQDEEVRHAVSDKPWNISWFIATGTSNHQHGYAVDVSLARIQETEIRTCGECTYLSVAQWEEYVMPTPIHELSSTAATFTAPTASNSKTAWRNATLAPGMNDAAIGLQGYCTGAGLTPLASEWWHFNDLDSRAQILEHMGSGGFVIHTCVSKIP